MIRILSALFLLMALPASAQMPFSSLDEVIEIKVREGWRTPTGRHFAGFEVRLADGWKTYWRSPGATGIAPQLSWRGSRNISGVALHWPTPTAFLTAGYPSLGYVEDFVLPFEVQATNTEDPISVVAQIEIGVCLDICLPAKVTVRAELPPYGGSDPQIAAALRDKPREGTGQVTCAIRPSGSGVMLSAEIPQSAPLGAEEAVAVELLNARDRIWIADTSVVRTGRILRTQTEFMRPDESPVTFDRSGLRFTVVGSKGAVEYFGCVGR